MAARTDGVVHAHRLGQSRSVTSFSLLYDQDVETIKVSEARQRLNTLVREASDSHEPVAITGKQGTAVLVAEEDWRAIQETLYLLSVPGMRESIREGMAAPSSECADEPGW